MSLCRDWDRRIARVEAGLAVAILLAMVLVASLQAALFNLAEVSRAAPDAGGLSGSSDAGWASAWLGQLGWADVFLQKGTLWITFLGASLATYDDKHIRVDAPTRFLGERTAGVARRVAGLGVALVCFLLAVAFYEACRVADRSVPFDYEWLTPVGPAHVCDAAPADLGATERPVLLCALRSALGALHVQVSSGGGIAQLIAPLMLVVIGIRSFMRALIKPETSST